MTELKKCPFCGRDARNNPTWMVGSENSAECSNRHCITNKLTYATIEEWNTRPLEDALQARIDELKQENERLQIIASELGVNNE